MWTNPLSKHAWRDILATMDASPHFEMELAALTEAITAERGPAETVNTEKVHQALKEKISELLPASPGFAATDDTTQVPVVHTQTSVTKGQAGSKSYLDTVDDATVAKVNEYIAKVFQNGIQATIREVIETDPFMLDVFHDALTDKLYGELQARGLVK